jgi:dihydroxycyclohexadiene carboxylate dehydrogenase
MIHLGRFKNKVMMVTGAAQGIGRSVALYAAKEGAKVLMVDRSEMLYDVCREDVFEYCTVKPFIADMEVFEGCQLAVNEAVNTWGGIDILINNVGGTIWAKPYQHYQPEQIDKEIRRSLYPTLWCCRAVLPQMLLQGGGAIVNVSSIATRSINRVPYAAAKGGVNAITASLAFEFAEKNIRINAVATGGTLAPERKIPRNANALSEDEKHWYQQIIDQTTSTSLMKRYGTIEEQVSAILFLASDEASYITGHVLPVGGGDQG